MVDYKKISEQLKNEKNLTEEERRKLDEERYNKLLQKQLQEYQNFIESNGLVLDRQNKSFTMTIYIKPGEDWQNFSLSCSDWGLRYNGNKQIIPFTDFGWTMFKTYLKLKEEKI